MQTTDHINTCSTTSGRIDAALAAIRRGECVAVLDGEDRENEGDLVTAAELATPETLAFIIRHTSGVVCVSLADARADELDLPLMVATPEDRFGTAFTVSVDWRHDTTTGISASDRAAAIRGLAAAESTAQDFVRPGHVFPLRAHRDGVLGRPGHTEASLDLARLAGLVPVGVLSEIVNDDGTMARRAQLLRFAAQHGLVSITIEDLIGYRRERERSVTHASQASLATWAGTGTLHAYVSHAEGVEHAALVIGPVESGVPTLVRVHSECLTGDVLGSERCDCGAQLQASQRLIGKAGRGVIVYLRGHEGRGIGLASKVAAYDLQDSGLDTVDANLALGLPVDARNYDDAAFILRDLGVTSIQLLTNNPNKCAGLEAHGLSVERVPLCLPANPHNVRYLNTKRRKLGHLDDSSREGVRQCAVGD